MRDSGVAAAVAGTVVAVLHSDCDNVTMSTSETAAD